jgi:hypothetical protein
LRNIQKFLQATNVLPFSATQVFEIEGKYALSSRFPPVPGMGYSASVENRTLINPRSQQLEKDA